MAGVVRNPCPDDITLTTGSSCLVTTWSVTDSSGRSTSSSPLCSSVITTWTVKAGSSVDAAEPWGTLASGGSFTLDVTFNDSSRTTASKAFTTP